MSAALGGVLSVDKGVVFFAILVSVGDGNLNVFTRQVDDGV